MSKDNSFTKLFEEFKRKLLVIATIQENPKKFIEISNFFDKLYQIDLENYCVEDYLKKNKNIIEATKLYDDIKFFMIYQYLQGNLIFKGKGVDKEVNK